jgi:TolB-like protein/DNA-binding winged helix-turn-helix (wHTH) protein
MSDGEVDVLQFDGFELDLSTGELRGRGTRVSLQPQPFKILALLAGRAGQTLTREEIRLELWGNETFVDFEGSLNFCIRQIRKALDEDARRPRYIETLHRRGYRFLVPVRRARPGASPGLSHEVGLIRPMTVAVLPLSELNCPSQSRSVSEGLAELLITYLSTNRSVRVASRTSTMKYRHSEKSLSKIGRELGVERVLEGAVLHSGNRVRIAARLIDTSTDRNEWAGCYESEMQDWLKLQDHLASSIIRDTAFYFAPHPAKMTPDAQNHLLTRTGQAQAAV